MLKKHTLGVIVGRFQVPVLHRGHQLLVNKALEECEKVLVFLGVSPESFTLKDPLPFVHRRHMFYEEYEEEVMRNRLYIHPLLDMPENDQEWVRELDKQISVLSKGNVMVYGSRDSFLDTYKICGTFKTTQVQPEVYASGTEIRENIRINSYSNPDIRKGIIHAVMNTPKP